MRTRFCNTRALRPARLVAVEGSQERAGRNEAIFREVNENIAKLEDRMGSGSEWLPVICECATATCTTQIEIGLDDYARVRRHPDQFIVARGHEQPDVERVVEEHREYSIVEKQGTAAAAADAIS